MKDHPFKNYVTSLEKSRETGQATEHSYRPALKTFVEIIDGQDVNALNEPSRIECGAPDFIISRQEVTIGYIECKDIDSKLDIRSKQAINSPDTESLCQTLS